MKGAFTGANENRQGLFQAAHGGTLFMDEIGNMSLTMQVKLYRVLQEGKVRPIGSTEESDVDVRIIAATNKDFEKEIAEGRFREDLYYRLSVIPIQLPPLRERREDIPLLARHFLESFREIDGKAGRRAFRRKRCAGWSPTTGPATCASWKTPWSAPWRWRPQTKSPCAFCQTESPGIRALQLWRMRRMVLGVSARRRRFRKGNRGSRAALSPGCARADPRGAYPGRRFAEDQLPVVPPLRQEA